MSGEDCASERHSASLPSANTTPAVIQTTSASSGAANHAGGCSTVKRSQPSGTSSSASASTNTDTR